MKNLKSYIYKKKLNFILSVTSFFVFSYFTVTFLNLDLKTISLGFSRIGNVFSRMLPLDTTTLDELAKPLFDTLLIAFFSSVLGVVTAIIFLPYLMTNLFKHKLIPKIISGVLSIFRTIPALIIAAILVSLFSTGNFSGFMSLYVVSFLTAAKLLKEYAEEVNEKNIESLVALGASKIVIYKIAVLSNIKVAVYSVFFLVLESSIRGASILGLVGAGGIGQKLWEELNHLRYDRVAVIILILIGIIFIIDNLSVYFRNSFEVKLNTKKEYFFKKRIEKIIFILVIITACIYFVNFLDITLERFLVGVEQLKTVFKRIFTPDISYLEKTLVALYESILVAVFSTFFASITAIFLSYFSATNLFGKKALIVKIFINIIRTFPAIIIAIILFRGFGPGYVSSFFAIYIYTVGVTTKMYNEVLEGVNKNLQDAVNSLGVKKFISYIKIIFFGTFPEFVSISLYRLEMNLKNSTILGMVGAGGIGHLLVNNIEFRNWEKISTLLICLTLAILIIENISALIRNFVKK